MTLQDVPAATGTTPRPPPEQRPVPPLRLPRPTNRYWREEALARAAEMAALGDWLNGLPQEMRPEPRDADRALDLATREHLNQVVAAAGDPRRFRNAAAELARATGHLDAAEAQLLRRLPLEYLRGQLPTLQAFVRQHLPIDDPRRHRVDRLADEVRRDPLSMPARESLITAVRAAAAAAQREQARVRSFRNIVLVATASLVVAAVLVCALGWSRPELVPLCFRPQQADVLVCPTGSMTLTAAESRDVDEAVGRTVSSWDVPLVQLVGMLSAAIVGATTLRHLRGTSTPFAIPVALTLLKLPTGALTAFVGLLLMRGGFVPGLTALDTTPQILAWAVVFGSSQQFFTRLVDRQAQDVLNSVGGKAYAPAGQT